MISWSEPAYDTPAGYFVLRESVLGVWMVMKVGTEVEQWEAATYDFASDLLDCLIVGATQYDDINPFGKRRYQVLSYHPTTGLTQITSLTGAVFDSAFANKSFDNKVLVPDSSTGYIFRDYALHTGKTVAGSQLVDNPIMEIDPIELTEIGTQVSWRERSSFSSNREAVFDHEAGDPAAGYPTKLQCWDDNLGTSIIDNGWLRNQGKERWQAWVWGSNAFGGQADYFRDPYFGNPNLACPPSGVFDWNDGPPNLVQREPWFVLPWNIAFFSTQFTECTWRITGYGAGLRLVGNTVGGTSPPCYVALSLTYDAWADPMLLASMVSPFEIIHGFTNYSLGYNAWNVAPAGFDWFAGQGAGGGDFLFNEIMADNWNDADPRYREIRFRPDGANTPFTVLIRDNPIPHLSFPQKWWRMGVVLKL